MGKYGVIDFDDDEIEAAGHWYHDLYLAKHGPHPTAGYPGSMLYAIMGRGALVGVADKINRAKQLASEAQNAARIAASQASKATGDAKKELLADVKGLRSIAKKAKQYVLNEAEKPRAQHATKKSPAQLQHEIDEVLARRSHSTKSEYRNFTVVTYPGGRGSPKLRWYRSPSAVTWSDARDRLIAAGELDPALAGRTHSPGGWMLSVDPSDYSADRAKPLP